MSQPIYYEVECLLCGGEHPDGTACRKRTDFHQGRHAAWELHKELSFSNNNLMVNGTLSPDSERSGPDGPGSAFEDMNTQQWPVSLERGGISPGVLGVNPNQWLPDSHAYNPAVAPADRFTAANHQDPGPLWGIDPSLASWSAPSEASPTQYGNNVNTGPKRRPRNHFAAHVARSQTGPYSNVLLADTEYLYCARCLYPGCENVIYSSKAGKSEDNLYQHHQKKTESHQEWLGSLASRKQRCQITVEVNTRSGKSVVPLSLPLP
ncbi:hypothetical protein TWF506_004668 [Arthrobotrys conoides]|uniref:Uncharacterized protein n=1 Tax=Arthrobotrys conoides TaxID=74498 RepID=A0AAN8RP37_9PEZI